MTPLTTIEETIDNMPVSDLPALIGMLAMLQAKAQIKLMTPQSEQAETETLLTIPEVAKRLKVSEYRSYELARQGILRCIRLGRSVRVKASAIDDYLCKKEP